MASCFFLLLLVSAVSSFSPSYVQPRNNNVVRSTTTNLASAMERLHDPSTNAFQVEHVYSLRDIDRITQKITDDEWSALGSVIAETMLETILDVGDDALKQRGWVERMSLTNRIAEEVSRVVEKTLYKRYVPRIQIIQLSLIEVHILYHNSCYLRYRHYCVMNWVQLLV